MKAQFFSISGIFITIIGVVLAILLMPLINAIANPEIHITVKEKLEEPCSLHSAMNALMNCTSGGMTVREMIVDDIKGDGDYNSEIKDIIVDMFDDRPARLEFGTELIENNIPRADCEYIETKRILVFPEKVDRKITLGVCFE